MKTVTIATHHGIFHADEVFALAVLKLFFEKKGKQFEVIRTRDLEKVAQADMAVDIGGEYAPARKRFDHHQKGRAGVRENGIPYASFGLIWKHFGQKVTSNKKVHETIDKKIVMPIDALDNGINITTSVFKGVNPYSVADIMISISKTFAEDETDLAFAKAVEIATLILEGEIKKVEEKIAGEIRVTSEILRQGEPSVLVLEKYASWDSAVGNYKNVKIVLFPDKFSSNWCLQVARDGVEQFGGDRINFPETWRGLQNTELSQVSGVSGAVFCHLGGFYAVVSSKEGAIELANKAILFDNQVSE